MTTGAQMTGTAHAETAQATAEHAWGFMRKDEDEPAKEAEPAWVTKVWWRFDAAVQKLTEIMSSRPSDPDAPLNKDDLERMIRESARMGAIYGMQHGGYSEAPKPGPDTWTKWMVTVCGMLAVSGVGAAIGMYGRLTSIEANQISQQKQIDYLIQIVMRRTP